MTGSLTVFHLNTRLYSEKTMFHCFFTWGTIPLKLYACHSNEWTTICSSIAPKAFEVSRLKVNAQFFHDHNQVIATFDNSTSLVCFWNNWSCIEKRRGTITSKMVFHLSIQKRLLTLNIIKPLVCLFIVLWNYLRTLVMWKIGRAAYCKDIADPKRYEVNVLHNQWKLILQKTFANKEPMKDKVVKCKRLLQDYAGNTILFSDEKNFIIGESFNKQNTSVYSRSSEEI